MRAEFANPDRKLLPGMFANLTVTTGRAPPLTVPRTAIVYSLYGDTVFVVSAAPHAREQGGVSDNGGRRRAHRRAPLRARRPGARRKDRDRDGVRAGEQVVTAGQIKLQAITPVTIDETAALPPPSKRPRP